MIASGTALYLCHSGLTGIALLNGKEVGRIPDKRE
jgi:hypothetical protein